jgi:phosphomannomutase
MDENTDFENDELETEEEVSETRNPAREHQRKLEKELKQAKQDSKAKDAELSEAKAAQRELALMKAGIDTSSGAGKLFAKAYEGELTQEAITAQAEEYGLIATSQTSEVKQELAQLGKVAQASSGSNPGTVPATVFEDIRNATSQAEVLAAYAKHGLSLSTEEPGPIYTL